MTSILITAVTYFIFYQCNDWLFASFELHAGANWIYLPAGLRLLFTLLLDIEGATGIFIAALAISLSNFAHIDFTTMLVASVLSAAMPYVAYRTALYFGMPPTLENLSVKILFVLTFLYAFLNSAAHSLWYRLRDVSPDSLNTFFVMFIGDLIGTLIIIYTIKFTLVLFDRFRKKE
jgi:uncharacterized membrane protein